MGKFKEAVSKANEQLKQQGALHARAADDGGWESLCGDDMQSSSGSDSDSTSKRVISQYQMDNLARYILFTMLCSIEPRIQGMLKQRAVSARKELDFEFRKVVANMIEGQSAVSVMDATDVTRRTDMVSVTDATEGTKRSDMVTTLLEDLSDIGQVNTDPDVGQSVRYQSIKQYLMNSSLTGTSHLAVANQTVDVPNIVNIRLGSELLYELCGAPIMPEISSGELTEYFSVLETLDYRTQCLELGPAEERSSVTLEVSLRDCAQSSVKRQCQDLQRCCSLDEPSCVLTDLMVLSHMDRQLIPRINM